MRLIAFVTLLVLATLVPWYLWFFGVIVYALLWSWGVELFVVALLVDAYFGSAANWPLYACATLMIISTIELLKPRLSFYNQLH